MPWGFFALVALLDQQQIGQYVIRYLVLALLQTASDLEHLLLLWVQIQTRKRKLERTGHNDWRGQGPDSTHVKTLRVAVDDLHIVTDLASMLLKPLEERLSCGMLAVCFMVHLKLSVLYYSLWIL